MVSDQLVCLFIWIGWSKIGRAKLLKLGNDVSVNDFLSCLHSVVPSAALVFTYFEFCVWNFHFFRFCFWCGVRGRYICMVVSLFSTLFTLSHSFTSANLIIKSFTVIGLNMVEQLVQPQTPDVQYTPIFFCAGDSISYMVVGKKCYFTKFLMPWAELCVHIRYIPRILVVECFHSFLIWYTYYIHMVDCTPKNKFIVRIEKLSAFS